MESSCNFRVRALSKQGRPGRGTPHMAVPGVEQESAALDQAMLTVSGSASIIAHPQLSGQQQVRIVISSESPKSCSMGYHRRHHHNQGAMACYIPESDLLRTPLPLSIPSIGVLPDTPPIETPLPSRNKQPVTSPRRSHRTDSARIVPGRRSVVSVPRVSRYQMRGRRPGSYGASAALGREMRRRSLQHCRASTPPPFFNFRRPATR